MRKIRVGLIFGGKSAEHEVSLQSAGNILDALDPQRFEPVLIGIDKQGQWHVNDPDSFLLHADDPARIALHRSGRGVALLPGAQQQQLRPIQPEQALALAQIDVVFPIVHGTLGEDGSLQGLLRMANLPFVGSGVLGSAVAMDKDMAKRVLRDARLAVAPFVCFDRHTAAHADVDTLIAQLGLPLFVKPANQAHRSASARCARPTHSLLHSPWRWPMTIRCWWKRPLPGAKSNAPCWAMPCHTQASAAKWWCTTHSIRTQPNTSANTVPRS